MTSAAHTPECLALARRARERGAMGHVCLCETPPGDPPPLTGDKRRERIFGVVADAVSDLLYYDRNGDEDLPIGSIEEAITAGELDTEDLVRRFRAALLEGMS